MPSGDVFWITDIAGDGQTVTLRLKGNEGHIKRGIPVNVPISIYSYGGFFFPFLPNGGAKGSATGSSGPTWTYDG